MLHVCLPRRKSQDGLSCISCYRVAAQVACANTQHVLKPDLAHVQIYFQICPCLCIQTGPCAWNAHCECIWRCLSASQSYVLVQELCELLIDGNADVKDAITSCVLNQPFKLICQRLLHHMDDNSLLDFLTGILGQLYSQRQLQRLALTGAASDVKGAAEACQQLEQLLQLLIFGCVKWQQLDELSLHVAMAFHFQQLQKGSQATDKLQVINWLQVISHDNTASALCSIALSVANGVFSLSSDRTLLSMVLRKAWLLDQAEAMSQVESGGGSVGAVQPGKCAV